MPKGGEKQHKLEDDEWTRMDGEIEITLTGGPAGKKRRKSSTAKPLPVVGESAMEGVEDAVGGGKEDWYDSDSDDSFTGPLMPSPSDPAHPKYKPDLELTHLNPSNRPRYVVRYLIGKARHKEAMREREELEAELEGVKRELKASWEWKEKALDAVLARDMG